MSEKFKVQVAAKIDPNHPPFYRRAGLVLTTEQQEKEVDLHQLAILRADKSVIVVGGPEILPKPAAAKPADEKDARLQQLAEAHDVAASRAKQAEDEISRLKAELGDLKAKQERAKKEK